MYLLILLRLKTELGANIVLILSFGWWLVKSLSLVNLHVTGKFLCPLTPPSLPDTQYTASL